MISKQEKDHYLKTDEIIAKFKDGKERFMQSALFNRVVQMLVRDADPIDIIDHLITVTDDTQKAFEQYIIRTPMPPRITGTADELIKSNQ